MDLIKKQIAKENLFKQPWTISNQCNQNQKKCVALVAHGAKVQMRRVQGARFFIGQNMYNNRSINFLKHATFVVKRDVRLITDLTLIKNGSLNLGSEI